MAKKNADKAQAAEAGANEQAATATPKNTPENAPTAAAADGHAADLYAAKFLKKSFQTIAI